MQRLSLTMILGFAAVLSACDSNSAGSQQSPAKAAPVASPAPSIRGLADNPPPRGVALTESSEGDDESAESWCAPPDPKMKPMLLLKFRFSSGVKRREPVDKLNITRPGQRVYAHLTVRNRSGRRRCLHVEFRVGNKRRTRVTLKIGKSWSWRTWAYNTSRMDDRGPLQLTIRDDQGKVFLSRRLAIVPENPTPTP